MSKLVDAIVKPNAIVKIHKYKVLHERHHFIPTTVEVHGALGHDMYRVIKECVHFFYDKQLGGHLSLSFCIQIFRQCVNIILQHI
jgi:hypothetical protein